MDDFVVPRLPPEKPPLLSQRHAAELWYETRRLQKEKRVAIQRKEKYKSEAANAGRRCVELEARLYELERRASQAEARVEHLSQQLTKYETQRAGRVLKQKLLSLVKMFHPDKKKSTTPTEVCACLNAIAEELDD